MNDLILYTTEDGRSQIKLRAVVKEFLTTLIRLVGVATVKHSLTVHGCGIDPPWMAHKAMA